VAADDVLDIEVLVTTAGRVVSWHHVSTSGRPAWRTGIAPEILTGNWHDVILAHGGIHSAVLVPHLVGCYIAHQWSTVMDLAPLIGANHRDTRP